METNQIKKFAQEARTILQRGVRNRLLALGFNANGDIEEKDMPVCGADHVVFMGRVIGDVSFYRKWMSLYERIRDNGVQYICEEAAYTWFNRLMAIRIMVKNGFADPVLEYQSEALRIPRIVTDARRGVLPQMSEADRELLMELLEDDTKTTEQFAVLIVNYCKHQPILSACFGAVTDYTELLLPTGILAEGGFVDMLNHTAFISDDDYRQSELIGWLYQFYISEKKDDVFASFKKGKKAEAEDIPAATQIFTPNWIVKYMVQNTLGHIYMDNNPYATDIFKGMAYLVQPDSPAPADTVFHYEDIHALTIADLACGSGHILNEAFDLLYSIYIEEGYNRRRAIEDIFRYNLLGLDLDPRAKQLAMFALLMKACRRDPSFLDAHCLPRVLDMGVATAVRRLNAGDGLTSLLTEFFAGAGKQLIAETVDALALLEQADNLGSIMKFSLSDTTRTAIAMRTAEWKERGTDNEDMQTLLAAFDIVLALTDKYAALAMNPPYMGGGNMNAELSAYVKKNYEDGKADLATVFVERMPQMLMKNGRYSFIIPPSWMFLSTFEGLRKQIIEHETIDSLLHLSRGVFGADFGASSAVIIHGKSQESYGTYFRLVERTFQEFDQKHLRMLFEQTLANPDFKYNFKEYNKDITSLPYSEEGNRIYYPHVSQQNFKKIPGCPIGYWVSEKMIEAFGNDSLSMRVKSGKGLDSGNNDKFLRYWQEVSFDLVGIGYKNYLDALQSKKKWFPFNKGGTFRRWYGNNEYLINWENNGEEIKNYEGSNIRNQSFYFQNGITFPRIGSNKFSARYSCQGAIFDGNGPMCFTDDKLLFTLAYMNTSTMMAYIYLLCPTISFQIGDIFKVPFKEPDSEDNNEISNIVSQNISISRSDWDAHETSWDFQRNELLGVDEQTYMNNINWEIERHYRETGERLCIDAAAPRLDSLEWRMQQYRQKWERLFLQLHDNEEELNRQFIGIYGLEDELTPDVPLDEVTILQQGEISIESGNIVWHDDEVIRQFVSYAVGCMMGRYRLDKPGLHIAHPNPADEEVCTYPYNGQDFTIDEDGIIPLMTRDCPFPDNAGERFKHFLKVAFGTDTLTENLNFVEAALGKDIESYFVKDFWKDHLLRYQRRPIYWLFSSKKGAFQCIAYMHRMNPYTVEQIRNKYLLPHMEYLGDRIMEMESRGAALTVKERKLLEKFRKDLDECREYHDRLHEVADRQIAFDLDDGVVVNYAKFGDVLAKLK